MTTRNRRKLAALNKENCEEHPRSNLAQNSSAPRSQEDYITQVSEEIEGRVTKRLSKEFSRTENRILGALARLDDFLMNPILPRRSGTTPEPSRNALNTSQGTNEDDSQNDPRPEAGLFHGQITQSSGPERDHDTQVVKICKQGVSVDVAFLSCQNGEEMVCEMLLVERSGVCFNSLSWSVLRLLDHTQRRQKLLVLVLM